MGLSLNSLDNKALEQHRQDVSYILDLFSLNDLSGKRILLSEDRGFVSYWLLVAIDTLNRAGHKISVTVLESDGGPNERISDTFGRPEWLTPISGDLTQHVAQDKKFDLLIHNPLETSTTNSVLTVLDSLVSKSRAFFEFAVTTPASRILLLGNWMVYGRTPDWIDRVCETLPPDVDTTDPLAAYGEGVRYVESLATAYAREYGLDIVMARCFPHFGAKMPRHLALPQFIRDALHSDEIYVLGDGKPVRSHIYGSDMAIWLLALLTRGRKGAIYNVGSDIEYSMEALAREIASTLSPHKAVSVLDVHSPPYVGRLVPDTSRIRRELGVRLWTSLSEGVSRMANQGCCD